MKLKCLICGSIFASLDIDKNKAIKEVSDNYVKHLVKAHPKESKQMQKEMGLLLHLTTWLVTIKLAEPIERVKEFEEIFDKQVETVLEILGLSEENNAGEDDKHDGSSKVTASLLDTSSKI